MWWSSGLPFCVTSASSCCSYSCWQKDSCWQYLLAICLMAFFLLVRPYNRFITWWCAGYVTDPCILIFRKIEPRLPSHLILTFVPCLRLLAQHTRNVAHLDVCLDVLPRRIRSLHRHIDAHLLPHHTISEPTTSHFDTFEQQTVYRN